MSATDDSPISLIERLDAVAADGGVPDGDGLLEQFLEYVASRGIELYPAQEEAVLELLAGKHVVLTTPTGSGKSLVAIFLHFLALAGDRVSFYTAPTKALVNEKFFDWCEAFGAENVGLLTGDGSVNPKAPVICCTAEILANMALRDDELDVDYVVMDEFHFYGDRERGAAWQIPLITLGQTVFLLMSATLGEVGPIAERLEGFSHRPVAVVRGAVRPVPLRFEYKESILHEAVEELLAEDAAPIYLVSFTQRDAAEAAGALMSVEVCSRDDKAAIDRELAGERFETPYGKEIRRLLRHGLGVHHAGLLPRYRRLVERLAQTGLIKVISGTDTLGVGVNIPIRTVVLRQLYKFDGQQNVRLSAREFHQIAGRAGRKGFDDSGRVVVLAPEWVAENRRIAAKIAAQPHRKKKLVKKRPPPGALPWDRKQFERLQAALPEPLEPRFEVNHGMLVNLLQGADQVAGGNGYRRLIQIIGRTHMTRREKSAQRRRAAQLVRSLDKADIVLRVPGPGGRGVRLELRSDLQLDFSLNHSLSLFLVEALAHLDREADGFALDALSAVEAVLEDPRVILRAQVRKQKGELVARLKAEGVPYEERMARLEQVEPPKPLADFLYATFDAFAAYHPWVGSENIRPKSIARELVERCMDFSEYVREYGLQRVEGLLLRHLSQAYKTAVQGVPEGLWTEGFEDALAFLHNLVRRTDASLLEEWELLVAGPGAAAAAGAEPAPVADRPGIEPRALAARVRTELHLLLKALAGRDFEAACGLVRQTGQQRWTPERFAQALEPLFAEHPGIDTTPRARQPRNTTLVQQDPGLWTAVHLFRPIERPLSEAEELARAQADAEQLEELEAEHEWRLEATVDLSAPPEEDAPLIELERITR